MADRIFKYTLQAEQRQLVHTPPGVRWLDVLVQNGFPVIYGLVDGDNLVPPERHIIRLVTTGENFNAEGAEYIGSVIIDGWFVGHIFDQPEGINDPSSDRFADDFRQLRDADGEPPVRAAEEQIMPEGRGADER